MQLSQEEATLLVDTIDQAVEGHKESKRLAENDPIFADLETYTDFMNEIDNRVDTLLGIKAKVVKYKERVKVR